MNEENRKRSDKRSFEEMGRKVDGHMNDAAERVDDEVQRVIAFLNDKVVPEVRQNSSKALRGAAEQLAKLAEHLDSRRGQ
jgi:bisphosphoglycerate-dependent phosphoglycerate mutase